MPRIDLKNNQDINRNVAILCFTYDHVNYGANFVAFSMQNIIKRFGFNPIIINFYPRPEPSKEERYASGGMFSFIEKFINYTPKIRNSIALYELNKYFSTFIVGSDQVWNYNNTKYYTGKYYLDFVKTQKNIIAFSASFGSERFIGSEKIVDFVKPLIERFDAISLREESGVAIVHNTFSKDIDCKATLDPTLLVDIEYYNKIIASENIKTPDEKYIGYYLLSFDIQDKQEYNKTNLNKIKNILNLPLKNIRGNFQKYKNGEIFKYSSPAQWLNYIKNAEFVITDSFHGTCFSILFKKNFVYINNIGGKTRVECLLADLGIENRIYDRFEDINFNKLLDEGIDYNKVADRLNKLKINSLSFLEKALNKSLEEEFWQYKQQKYQDEKKNTNTNRILTLIKEEICIQIVLFIRYFRYILAQLKKIF